jgi:8-amino-7-oxononanoate synthase/dethiobiotin synthase
VSGLDWVAGELAAWESSGLLRTPRVVETASAPEVEIDGRRVVLLCSNNYLGLADDPRVRSAAAAAARRWGAGSGGSRLVSGTASVHRDLERELAVFEGTDDAVLFSSGYLANIGLLSVLTGSEDVVFSDELNHASIVDGCRLSKARTEVYRHADVDHLNSLLGSMRARRRVVVTDTVFSMDGDLAPLSALVELCARHDAVLVVDEAHATGVLGASGAGAVEELGLVGEIPVVVGTLSKALGSAGGYVATTRDLAALLRNRARSHVFDTAPAPSTIAAARTALDIVGAEPERRARVRELARRVAGALRRVGYDTREPAAAVVPVHVGDAREAVALSERLLERGVFCPAIRPPSVPDGTSRLRVTVMATHTDEQIDRALEAFGASAGVHRVRSADAMDACRSRSVFVTGTDTGVGKTVVTAAIARALRENGARVAIFKPLQTGTIDGDDDAGAAARLSGCDAFTGVALGDPLAPSVAADLAGVDINVEAIIRRFREVRDDYDAVVVEGAGGLLVPIDETTTMAELARALELPVVIVARPALGTLNHTALTVDVARARGLHVDGVVISRFPSEPKLAERTNPSEIEKLADTDIIGVVPRLTDVDPVTFRDARDWLGPRFGGRFDRAAFLASLSSRQPVSP